MEVILPLNYPLLLGINKFYKEGLVILALLLVLVLLLLLLSFILLGSIRGLGEF